MDNVDRVFDTHFRLDFFGMLRSWHNNRATDPIWRRLDLVLVTSTEPYELIETPNLSPFNVGQLISLQDFSKDEMSILNDRHGAPLSDEQVSELAILLGGHPYLVRRALDLVARRGLTFERLIETAGDQDGPFGDHLKYHLFRLHSQPDLFEALREALRTKKCENDAVFWQLSGAGLIKRNGEYVLPQNKLYGDYFMRHLLG